MSLLMYIYIFYVIISHFKCYYIHHFLKFWIIYFAIFIFINCIYHVDPELIILVPVDLVTYYYIWLGYFLGLFSTRPWRFFRYRPSPTFWKPSGASLLSCIDFSPWWPRGILYYNSILVTGVVDLSWSIGIYTENNPFDFFSIFYLHSS